MTFENNKGSNNAQSLLLAGISNSSLSMQCTASEGAIFPSAFPFRLIIEHYNTDTIPKVTKREEVKVTNRVGDVFTIVRSAGTVVQDDTATPKTQGTTAYSFDADDQISLYITAEETDDMKTEIARLETDKLDISDYTSDELINSHANLLSNLTIVASRTGSAETITLKTLAGTDPSASDPIKIAFRNATIGSGTFSVLTLSATTAITIPSTATMGATNSVAFRLWLVGFNDGGTFRLGVINTAVTGEIVTFSEGQLTSSTIMNTSSDFAGVFYTGTAVASMPYRILGYLEYTLGTVGTWGTPPSKIQIFGPGIKKPGDIIQTKFTSTGAVATGATRTPRDDSIPQIGEGNEYMTLTVTPVSAINKLAIETVSTFTNSSADNNTVALHQAGVNDALAVSAGVNGAANMISVPVNYVGPAGVAVGTAYSVRIGSTTGTITFNGSGGARKYGGAGLSRMKITEYMV